MRAPAIQPAGTVAGVDLFIVELDGADPALAALLSGEERARADRFLQARDRERFVTGRAALRLVVAGRAGVAPEALAIEPAPGGKPRVAGGPPFSLSRADGLALLGVGRGRALGVDLERVREVPEADAIAARVLGPRELAAWRAAGAGRGDAFLRAWTRTEALVKALGLGLGAGPPPEDEADVFDLDVAPGFRAALAVVRREG
ncbi:MAG: 4'-phosphopantetheinyl transferase superfamily protein [Anaeromyxobacteraceae bacterium]